MSPFHTAVLSGSHKQVPRNGCPEFERVCEGGREGERMMKNSEQEMENLIVLLSHSKRERVYVGLHCFRDLSLLD